MSDTQAGQTTPADSIKWNRHGADVRNELGEGFRASLGL
jgi:hypothetical protein